MARNEMRMKVGAQKISYQIQSSPIVSGNVVISVFVSVLQSNSIHNTLYIAGIICLSFFENYRLINQVQDTAVNNNTYHVSFRYNHVYVIEVMHRICTSRIVIGSSKKL